MTDEVGVEAVADGYAAAIEELEQILADLEREDVDVDVLTEKVARAAELVKFCRERITAAQLQVTKIVADLEITEAAGASDE